MRAAFLFLISIFFLTIQDVSAQFVQAYEDFRNYFYVFENGMPQQLESQRVIKYVVSAESVVYIDNAKNLKAWYHGEKFDLGEGNNLKFTSSRKFITYQRDQTLYVFDNGKTMRLTNFLKEYTVGDEIIVFKEDNYEILKAYINGEIVEVDYTLVSKLGAYKLGDNLVAYTNGARYFKVFHNKELMELEQWEPTEFLCGRDMVAYVDGTTQYLKLYYNDKILKLENFAPRSMQMGDNVFAYINNESEFMVFTNGKLLKVELFEPTIYQVKDNVCAFFMDNKLQVLQDGVRYQLEYFMPSSYQISNNNMAWLDNSGRLKMFDKGKVITVSTDMISDYTLNGDVLKYIGGDNYPHIYCNGKNF